MGQRDCRAGRCGLSCEAMPKQSIYLHITAIPNLASIAERGVLLSIDSGNVTWL